MAWALRLYWGYNCYPRRGNLRSGKWLADNVPMRYRRVGEWEGRKCTDAYGAGARSRGVASWSAEILPWISFRHGTADHVMWRRACGRDYPSFHSGNFIQAFIQALYVSYDTKIVSVNSDPLSGVAPGTGDDKGLPGWWYVTTHLNLFDHSSRSRKTGVALTNLVRKKVQNHQKFSKVLTTTAQNNHHNYRILISKIIILGN